MDWRFWQKQRKSTQRVCFLLFDQKCHNRKTNSWKKNHLNIFTIIWHKMPPGRPKSKCELKDRLVRTPFCRKY